MATATRQTIDALSNRGRAAALTELRGILEREHANKPARGDGERRDELCDALNISGAKLLEFRAVIVFCEEQRKCLADAEAVLSKSETEKLEDEWSAGTTAYEKAFAHRQSLKIRIEESRTADRAARGESDRAGRYVAQIEGAFPLLFGRTEAPIEPESFLRKEIGYVMKRLTSEGE